MLNHEEHFIFATLEASVFAAFFARALAVGRNQDPGNDFS